MPIHGRLCVLVLSLFAAVPASAADLGGLPTPTYGSGPAASMPAPWYGVYAGINAGYGYNYEFTHEISTIPYNGLASERFRSPSNGFTGGGQVGYNYQMGHVVLGIEADLNYASMSRSVTSASGGVTEAGSAGYIGTLRPRLGLAFGPFLVYGTGGLAFGNFDTTITGNTGNTLAVTDSTWRVGWVAGGGVEYALDRNWSIRGEFLHTDLGRADLTGVGLDGNTYAWRDRLTDNQIRLGINFRF